MGSSIATSQDLSSANEQPLDSRVLATLVGDDPRLHERLFRRFADEAGQIVLETIAALAAGDLSLVGRHAHKLKSSSATVGAQRMAAACRAIEGAVHAADYAEVSRQCRALEHEMDRVAAFVGGIGRSALTP